jgi:RHS repeat-associated protein
MTLDDTGTPQSLHSYDAWGVVQEGTPAPFGFTGEVQQAGLVYLRARWYAAGSGTFTSRDPFAGYTQQPYSLHPYQYAYSDPLRWTDSSGRCIPGFDPDCEPVYDCFAWEPGCQRSDLNLADGRKYVQMVGEPFVGIWNAAYHDITRSPQQRWDDFTFHLTHYSPLAGVFAPTDPLALPMLGAGPNLRWQWEQGVATWQSFSTYIGDMVCRDSARLGRGLSKTALALLIGRGGKFAARRGQIRATRSTLGTRVAVEGRQVRGKFPPTAQANEILYRSDQKGAVTHYQVYDADGLPIMRVDITGKAHGGVPTPHVVEFQRNVAPDGTIYVRPNRLVRPANTDELP